MKFIIVDERYLYVYRMQNTVHFIKKLFPILLRCEQANLSSFMAFNLPHVKKNFIVSTRHIDTKSASHYFSFVPSYVTACASIESNLLSLSPRLINRDWIRVWLLHATETGISSGHVSLLDSCTTLPLQFIITITNNFN